MNRITSATENTNNYYVTGIEYDKNGNLTKLKRKGVGSLIDDLHYTYYDNQTSNRLQRVSDSAGNTEGFNDGASATTEYTYDTNGNMTSDLNKGIAAIAYNHLNLPTSVTMGAGTISYIYDAVGTKLKKTAGSSVTEYANGYVYSGTTSSTALQFFNHPEGYVYKDGSNYKYVYQYKDHLGNIRLSYEDGNDNGSVDQSEIVEENNYYPFGLKHKGYNSGTSPLGNSVANRWKFGGKEYQEELDLAWYDVTARNYDPALGRWMNVDPLAEQYAPYSPYSFVANNPINNQEVDGRWWFSKNKKNKANPYGRVAHSQYAFKMSSVRAVHKKQTGWASYIPTIGNFLNGSAMIQKLEDPSMSLDKGDIASLFLGGYFKGTRKLVKAAGAYQGAAKTALKLSEEFTTLTQSIASSPELKESWVELAVMKHFAGATSDGGNIIGTLTGTQETDYTTMFTFSEDFVGELQGVYGNEFDALKDTSGMSRESYIENKVQGHIQQMFESKKTEIMKQFDE